MRYKAVVFDFDGTLVDSVKDIAISCNFVLKKYGFPERPERDYRAFVGGGVQRLWQKLLPDTPDLSEYIDVYRRHYIDSRTPNSLPYQGICALLDALCEKGVMLFVLSNKPDAETKQMTARIFPEYNFAEVRGQIPGCPVKPSPQALYEIMGETGLSSSDFLFVGDSEIDMKTAVNAGMPAVGCLWGLSTVRGLFSAGADFLASAPADIMELF